MGAGPHSLPTCDSPDYSKIFMLYILYAVFFRKIKVRLGELWGVKPVFDLVYTLNPDPHNYFEAYFLFSGMYLLNEQGLLSEHVLLIDTKE